MPWIASVTPDASDPRVSTWRLATRQFGRDWEFTWVAKDLAPLPQQKIHWRSQDGLNNRGAVRFVKKGEEAVRRDGREGLARSGAGED